MNAHDDGAPRGDTWQPLTPFQVLDAAAYGLTCHTCRVALPDYVREWEATTDQEGVTVVKLAFACRACLVAMGVIPVEVP